MRIFKYGLKPEDWQVVEMPEGAQILTVQLVKGCLVMWAAGNKKAALVKRTIAIYQDTSGELSGNACEYLATVQTHGGAMVQHVFEIYGQGQ